ncbi:MAG: D-alanyl-D-alanine carboxypeptidase, partial [Clostridia bacterium]|nr:D-alanyl-D-alanine carboxypeptidase [Clostridia bacterium]
MKRLFALLLTVCVFLTLTPHACAAPNTSAESAILIDAADGEILYEKNAETPLPMASTTKIMTALIVLENADLSQTVTVPKE